MSIKPYWGPSTEPFRPTREEVKATALEALRLHLDGMQPGDEVTIAVPQNPGAGLTPLFILTIRTKDTPS